MTDGVVARDHADHHRSSVPPRRRGGIVAFPSAVSADGVADDHDHRDAQGRARTGRRRARGRRSRRATATRSSTAPSPASPTRTGRSSSPRPNLVNETVTYTAVDVTDGELPVPGQRAVTFSDGTGTACGERRARRRLERLRRHAVRDRLLRRDFYYGGVNWGGCPGASVPAFQARPAPSTSPNFLNGDVYRFGVDGGAVSSANISPPSVRRSAGRSSARTAGSTRRAAAPERAASRGARRRARSRDAAPSSARSRRTSSARDGLAVDPLSGDLFFDGACFGGARRPPRILPHR